MNQIKYLVNASVIVLLLFLFALTIQKISSLESSHQPESVVIITSPNDNNIPMSLGKKIFQNNCQSCHALDKNLTGPALRGVESRGPWTERKNLIRWVKNPAAMINESEYTKSLYKLYGSLMTPFPNLTDEEINAVFDYIKETLPQSSPVPVSIAFYIK